MDLGATFQENLRFAGSSECIPDKCFSHLVLLSCRGVMDDSDKNLIAGIFPPICI